MTIGKQKKNGVIMKVRKGSFRYYSGRNDNMLKPLLMPNGKNIKTLKLSDDGVCAVANNKISVVIYPSGRVDITPSK
tara:strand:+ start:1232 stop:1462 length:231 start_codon:yes stop_codon:yes gene_type:complete